jgi:PAS domain-containing protein
VLFDAEDLELLALARAADQKLRNLTHFVKYLPAPVVMLDKEMNIIAASRIFSEMFWGGIGWPEWFGQNLYECFLRDLNHVIPQEFKDLHKRVLAGERVKGERTRWDGPDGVMWFCHDHQPVVESGGAVVGMTVWCQDITKQVELEELQREHT